MGRGVRRNATVVGIFALGCVLVPMVRLELGLGTALMGYVLWLSIREARHAPRYVFSPIEFRIESDRASDAVEWESIEAVTPLSPKARFRKTDPVYWVRVRRSGLRSKGQGRSEVTGRKVLPAGLPVYPARHEGGVAAFLALMEIGRSRDERALLGTEQGLDLLRRRLSE